MYKVPLMGLGSKLYLAEEWIAVSEHQRAGIIGRLGVVMMEHLRGMEPRQSQSSDAQKMSSSLAGLMDIVAALQESGTRVKESAHVSVDICFSCSLDETLSAPQAAIVKLLLAEQLQDQCSLLLCDRLSHEHDATSTAGDMADGEPKSANHTQRRRANRKKLLKKRRHEAEVRSTQQALLKAALADLKLFVRRKKEQTAKNVSEIVDDIVDRASVEAKPRVSRPSSSHTLVAILDASSSSKKKKKKKKTKKSEGDRTSFASTGSNAVAASNQSAMSPTSTESKASCLSAAASVRDEKEAQTQQFIITPEGRPLLSFFDKSYSSPLSMSTFGPQPLYTTAPTPFFMSLAPQELDLNQRRRSERAEDAVAADRASSRSGVPDKTSEASYEWYLPSLFSSESSNHTNSTTSSLDWDFYNWQLKNEASTAKASAISGGIASRAPRSGSQATAASGKPYSLDSFSNMLGMDNSRHKSRAGDAAGENSSAEDSPNDSGSLAIKSDFLYQQGGFFDRQRSLKRRRRPLPFDYEEEDGCADSGDDDAWVECSHCCGCRCHRDEESHRCSCTQNDPTESARSEQISTSNELSSNEDADVKRESSNASARLAKLELALEEKTRVSAYFKWEMPLCVT